MLNHVLYLWNLWNFGAAASSFQDASFTHRSLEDLRKSFTADPIRDIKLQVSTHGEMSTSNSVYA